jgi:hypothetical protein
MFKDLGRIFRRLKDDGINIMATTSSIHGKFAFLTISLDNMTYRLQGLQTFWVQV